MLGALENNVSNFFFFWHLKTVGKNIELHSEITTGRKPNTRSTDYVTKNVSKQ